MPLTRVAFLLLAAPGCASWPRFAHWPEADSGASPVGQTAPVFGWTLLPAQASVDDEPGSVQAEGLQPGHGVRITSSLAGSGWDPDAVVDFAVGAPNDGTGDTSIDTGPSDTASSGPADSAADSGESLAPCTDTSGFPPVSPGDWTADVDWRVLDLSAPGQLCSVFRPKDADVRADVLLYTLDRCGTPYGAVSQNGALLGYRVDASENSWSQAVVPPDGGEHLAVVAAGWSPDAVDEAAYSWGIALVDIDDTCPELP